MSVLLFLYYLSIPSNHKDWIELKSKYHVSHDDDKARLLLLVVSPLLSGKLQNENKNKNLFWGISRALLSENSQKLNKIKILCFSGPPP
jgi:hypothetical protein